MYGDVQYSFPCFDWHFLFPRGAGWVAQALWAFLKIFKIPSLSSQHNLVQHIYVWGWVHMHCIGDVDVYGSQSTASCGGVACTVATYWCIAAVDLSWLTASPRDLAVSASSPRLGLLSAHHHNQFFFFISMFSRKWGLGPMLARQGLYWQLPAALGLFYVLCGMWVGGWDVYQVRGIL